MNTISSATKPKHWWLAKLRRWHTWVGLGAALFLLLLGITGVVLNYKSLILGAPGAAKAKEQPAPKADKEKRSGSTVDSDPLALPVTFAQALAIANRELDAGPLERVELKREGDRWLYKVKRNGGQELWLNALTGAHFIKGDYEKVMLTDDGQSSPRRFDWGKFVLDLHTGRIGGEAGKAVMTAAALGLLFLSMSGVYLYAKPLLIRRASARAGTSQRTAPRLPSWNGALDPARDDSSAPARTVPKQVVSVGHNRQPNGSPRPPASGCAN
ncbi:MAG: PepSY-associated TM helix domain-containing protein [Verrucomicrobia bacterium]|nr:PepSY-associated TM helix domain-containing protein [Verrucomicrobiota bacterium]